MAWKLNLVDIKELGEKGEEPKPGDMWFDKFSEPEIRDQTNPNLFLSPEYLQNWLDKRQPIWVRLPDGLDWCIDAKESGGTTGWIVTGEMLNLTARPSVRTCTYHGWLTDGMLSNDLDGRAYYAESSCE